MPGCACAAPVGRTVAVGWRGRRQRQVCAGWPVWALLSQAVKGRAGGAGRKFGTVKSQACMSSTGSVGPQTSPDRG